MGMKDIVEGELRDTVMRRGITGNFFFGLVPMLFYGYINFMALCLERLGVLGSEKPVPSNTKTANRMAVEHQ